MSIFSDMVDNTIEVFIDDYFVVSDSFGRCLSQLYEVFKRCEDCDQVLNWEKCHFMVRGYCIGSSYFREGLRG